jgi:hypothetical protein
MGFNRNIIIQADINRLMNPGQSNPQTLTANPPSGFVPATAPAGAQVAVGAAVGAAAGPAAGAGGGGAGPAAPGGVTVPTEDDYLTKLIKYVPVEVLAAYLLMAGVIDSNVTGKRDLSIWLGGLLVGVLLLSVPYVRQVLKVVRWSQIGMSLVGLTVYIFALGGWFATTTWYHQWYASIVVPVFALLIAILKLPPLPADPNG